MNAPNITTMAIHFMVDPKPSNKTLIVSTPSSPTNKPKAIAAKIKTMKGCIFNFEIENISSTRTTTIEIKLKSILR
ncbi:hypothetical protein GCM10007028_21980 [Algibacter mikhailovii]|uniref:Uncharacterized protein n=1 Tax=Algibacter mikhailovii TaxID=425498 RepID=A0A918R4Y4_9FLAO|nr:hypothetical protein GCM10007028_21980 [Algibacter mikhailovii]